MKFLSRWLTSYAQPRIYWINRWFALHFKISSKSTQANWCPYLEYRWALIHPIKANPNLCRLSPNKHNSTTQWSLPDTTVITHLPVPYTFNCLYAIPNKAAVLVTVKGNISESTVTMLDIKPTFEDVATEGIRRFYSSTMVTHQSDNKTVPRICVAAPRGLSNLD